MNYVIKKGNPEKVYKAFQYTGKPSLAVGTAPKWIIDLMEGGIITYNGTSIHVFIDKSSFKPLTRGWVLFDPADPYPITARNDEFSTNFVEATPRPDQSPELHFESIGYGLRQKRMLWHWASGSGCYWRGGTWDASPIELFIEADTLRASLLKHHPELKVLIGASND